MSQDPSALRRTPWAVVEPHARVIALTVLSSVAWRSVVRTDHVSPAARRGQRGITRAASDIEHRFSGMYVQ